MAIMPVGAIRTETAQDLVGLWYGKRFLGPEVRGRLLLQNRNGQLVADIAGYSVPATLSGDRISFKLPDGKGEFRGQLLSKARKVDGFWFQPPGVRLRPYASSITLTPYGRDGWQGEVQPLNETGTFYLPITASADGGASAFLVDIEMNRGIFQQVKRVTREGSTVRLLGNQRGQTEERVLVEGQYKDGRLFFPFFGAIGPGVCFDFDKAADESSSAFYRRGKPPTQYRYSPPVNLNDGWQVATLEEVGIARPAIESFIQMLIDQPITSVRSSQIHGVLFARHGKLVLEEYFHGHHRDRPHDTRSAAKSWVAVLIGAAMQAGIPIKVDTPVYETMLGSLPADLDPRKRAMTLEHLLTMTAGYDCDDRSGRPGDEDVMQSQTEEPDWNVYTLKVPMVATPGEKIVYCSLKPNLAGGVLEKVAKEPLPELFDRLVAKPLQMGTYHLTLTPTGAAYGGGGHYFLPRDFMKLSQLMMNDGQWGGKQITSKEWARKSTAALRDLSPEQQYGYLWNSKEYPYEGKTVRGYFAAGNGGQIFMAIPQLDLLITFLGGNYSDGETLRIPQRVLIPKHILPAVK
jgi:CubicO group peptidase (beta-lactamase class C family)